MNRTKIILVLGLIISGCAGSKSYVSFEILKPASFSYPESVNKIGYLNRAPLTFDAFPQIKEEEQDRIALYILDTLASNNLKKGILDALESSELSYQNEILALNERRRDTIDRDKPISPYFRANIFEEYSLDAIIVLEYYELVLEQTYPVFDLDYQEVIEEISIAVDLMWRIYSKDSHEPLKEYQVQDTLYYIHRPSVPLNATSIIRHGCYEIANTFGYEQVPFWATAIRILFRGGDPLLVKASVSADKDNWKVARDIWNELLSDENNKIAAKAYHNLAIYYELQDDIQTAKMHSAKAMELWDNTITETYYKALSERLKESAEINIQFRTD